MRHTAILAALVAAAATAQTLQWAWKGPAGNARTFGDQGGGNTVVAFPGAAGETTVVVGLSPGGSQSWTTALDTIAGAIGCVSPGGKVYLGGFYHVSEHIAEVVALSSGGSELWRFTYNSPNPHADEVRCLAANEQDVVYAGCTADRGSAPDFGLFAIDAATGVATDTLFFTSSMIDLYGLACDGFGDVYGIGTNWSGTDQDWAVFRWGGTGGPVWYATPHGATGLNDAPHGLALGSGFVAVAGQTQAVADLDYFAVAVLSSADGSDIGGWAMDNGGLGSVGVDAASDGSSIYAVGVANDSNSGQDLVVVGLTASGAERWVYRFDPGGNRYAWASGITVGPDGNVYAFGSAANSSFNSDMLIVSLTAGGDFRWVYRYDGGMDDYIQPRCGISGSDGKLYAAGSIRDGSGTKVGVISVAPVSGVQESPARTFKPAATGSMLAPGVLKLESAGTLFDSRGTRLADVRPGDNDLRRLARGVYFVSGALPVRKLVVP